MLPQNPYSRIHRFRSWWFSSYSRTTIDIWLYILYRRLPNLMDFQSSNHHSDFFIRSRIHWAVQCWQGSSMAKEIPPWGVIGLQDDVNGKTPVTIFGDNQAAITLSKDPVSHSKSKHMDIKFHWQREQVEKNEVRYELTMYLTNMYPQARTSPTSSQRHYRTINSSNSEII